MTTIFAVPTLVSWGRSSVDYRCCRPLHRRTVRVLFLSPDSYSTADPSSEQSMIAISASRHPLGPVSFVSTITLSIRCISFACESENFAAACLIRAVCISIRTISCSSVSTATSECISAAICKFSDARAGLQNLQDSPDIARVHLV